VNPSKAAGRKVTFSNPGQEVEEKNGIKVPGRIREAKLGGYQWSAISLGKEGEIQEKRNSGAEAPSS